jgi:endonuclease/exonuclease/phosphatase (EEP) superfamily protein YafD
VAFAYLLPQDLTDTHRTYARLATVAFYGRVFTFHAGLALLAAAAWGGLARRRMLLAVAAVAAVACLGPTVYASRPHTPPPAAGPSLRVMSVNLLFLNHDYPAILAAVRRSDPDVVVCEEYAFALDANLRPALTAAYPYQCVEPRPLSAGMAVFSKRPFTQPPATRADGDRMQIRTAVRLGDGDGDGDVVLYGVHPTSPHGPHSIVVNRLQTADLIRQASAERLPVVMAGDWNFTAETPNAAALRSAGLTDAFDLANPGGRAATWPELPRWAGWLPGVRIDHVYLSGGLTCTRYATVTADDGSDHHPIVADVAVAGRP